MTVPTAPAPLCDRSGRVAPGDDSMLRRIERRTLWLTAVATGVTAVGPGGGALAAIGVVAGALLSVLSYLVVKRSVNGLTEAIVARSAGEAHVPADDEPAEGARPRRLRPVGVVAFIVRHALLAGIAYVMIARLRLPPLALLVGASVIVLAAAAEVVRRPRHV